MESTSCTASTPKKPIMLDWHNFVNPGSVCNDARKATHRITNPMKTQTTILSLLLALVCSVAIAGPVVLTITAVKPSTLTNRHDVFITFSNAVPGHTYDFLISADLAFTPNNGFFFYRSITATGNVNHVIFNSSNSITRRFYRIRE